MIQNFIINRHSTLPILEMKLVEDGRTGSVSHENFFLNIQNARLFFTMTDIDTGVVRIAHQPAVLLENLDCPDTFNIGYEWKERDTERVGIYRGLFEIVFSNDAYPEFASRTLIVPIVDELHITVTDGSIKK